MATTVRTKAFMAALATTPSTATTVRTSSTAATAMTPAYSVMHRVHSAAASTPHEPDSTTARRDHAGGGPCDRTRRRRKREHALHLHQHRQRMDTRQRHSAVHG